MFTLLIKGAPQFLTSLYVQLAHYLSDVHNSSEKENGGYL